MSRPPTPRSSAPSTIEATASLCNWAKTWRSCGARERAFDEIQALSTKTRELIDTKNYFSETADAANPGNILGGAAAIVMTSASKYEIKRGATKKYSEVADVQEMGEAKEDRSGGCSEMPGDEMKRCGRRFEGFARAFFIAADALPTSPLV